MRNNIAAFADTIKEIVGGFTVKQMIAIGIVLGLALVLGFMIGALALYAAGVRKGRGQKKISARMLKQMQAEMREESDRALAEADRINQELLAERETNAAALQETMGLIEHLEQTNRAAEQNVREVEEEMRRLKEEGLAIPRKEKIEALTRDEILAFASGVEGQAPVSIYERGGDLPTGCRAGISTFMLVYERNGLVKIVLRLHKKTAADLKKRYKLFDKAAYPKSGDWYKWILTSEVKTLADVEIAIRMSYKYVYRLNYDAETGEVDAEYVNGEEAKINDEVLRYKDLPDRDFIVASGESESAAFSLYGKKGMADFVKSLASEYPVTVSETDSDTAPTTCKVVDKTFLLAYEKDGVSKMIFRVSEEEFDAIKKKHPRAEISSFPSSTLYNWYVTVIDESFRSNDDIEEIIKAACAHVYSLYN
ncbi:MAG: hypothetical protein IJU10_04835 [Clostridia bacterium]|nr:hypothetical protein [Clostridia bacterium]